MPDETPTTDTVQPAVAPIAQPGTAPASEVTFTKEQQERVNAIIKQRLDEDRARSGRQSPAPTPVAQPQPQHLPAPAAPPAVVEDISLTPKQMREELNELKLRRRFDTHAIKRGLEGQAAEDMFDLFKAQKPADDVQWFEQKSGHFGFGKPAAPTAETPTTAPNVPVAPGGIPFSDKGSPAPGGVTNWEREFADNPVGMSTAARALMDAKYGVEKGRRMRIEAAQARQGHIRVTVK